MGGGEIWRGEGGGVCLGPRSAETRAPQPDPLERGGGEWVIWRGEGGSGRYGGGRGGGYGQGRLHPSPGRCGGGENREGAARCRVTI